MVTFSEIEQSLMEFIYNHSQELTTRHFMYYIYYVESMRKMRERFTTGFDLHDTELI